MTGFLPKKVLVKMLH